MDAPSSDSHLKRAQAWWTTSIIDMHPGSIRFRGYAIEDLIGRIGCAEMVWLMLRGDLPTPKQGYLLEAALVAGVDHGPQAPSIAISRMAVTCGAPLNGAMASAINTLDDVHGGAGEQAMVLYENVARLTDSGADLRSATAQAISTWQATNDKHIPGFGHRFHPIDPRAPRLLELVTVAVKDRTVSGKYAAIALEIEAQLGRGKRSVPMNIDGATAVIFAELGFASPLGRGLFLLSRAVGILAHAWEQQQQGGRIKGPTPPDFLYRYAGVAARDLPAVK